MYTRRFKRNDGVEMFELRRNDGTIITRCKLEGGIMYYESRHSSRFYLVPFTYHPHARQWQEMIADAWSRGIIRGER